MMDLIKEFSDDFIEKFNSEKDKIASAENDIVSFITNRFKDFQRLSIESRIKTERSLREKIIRKNYVSQFESAEELFESIPDLLGIRIVSFLNSDEEAVDKELRDIFSDQSENENFTNQIVIKESKGCRKIIRIKFKDEPDTQKNGNPIYKYELQFESIEFDKSFTFNFEIQNKSLVHMFWGEIEHSLIYKNYDVVIDPAFVSGLMLTINNSLTTIDSQLQMIKNHLKPADNSYRQIELKQIASRVVAPAIDENFIKIYDHPIDLRPVYELLVSIYYMGRTKNENVLERTKSFISELSSFTISLDELEEINNSKTGLRLGDDCYKLATALREDPSYQKRALVAIYHRLNKLDKCTVYDELAFNIMRNIKNKINSMVDEIFDALLSDYFTGLNNYLDSNDLLDEFKRECIGFTLEQIVERYIKEKNFIYLNPPNDKVGIYLELIFICIFASNDLIEKFTFENYICNSNLLLSNIFENKEPDIEKINKLKPVNLYESVDQELVLKLSNPFSKSNINKFTDGKMSFSQIINEELAK